MPRTSRKGKDTGNTQLNESSLPRSERPTIIERGKTKLGDKTIADTLDLLIQKLEDSEDYKEIFKFVTKEALQKFKGKKILIGRARMFEDKTKDLDDPGMLALYKLSLIF